MKTNKRKEKKERKKGFINGSNRIDKHRAKTKRESRIKRTEQGRNDKKRERQRKQNEYFLIQGYDDKVKQVHKASTEIHVLFSLLRLSRN